MFENLSTRLQGVVRTLQGRGALSMDDVDLALREIRQALLEADVNFKVARQFLARVREAAVGQEVWASLTPGQQVTKIVYDELAALLGGQHRDLRWAPKAPTVILLVGLHGTGKTTTAGKLALLLRKRGRHPMLVAADTHRPAATKQVQVVGAQAGVPVFAPGTPDPLEVARGARGAALEAGCDVVIVDSAGRLHVDEALMDELRRMRDALEPHEVLLVVDAMTGQDAVAVAERFAAELGIDGVVITKLDGDARGGAALSVAAVTGRPIVFAGVGEKLDALEPFHPDRMASRILGMGDVLTLIEKAEAAIDEDRARELERKLRRREFTLEDFRDQLRQVKTMGPLEQVLQMIPGVGGQLRGSRVDDRDLARVEAIIDSMTPAERRQPHLIDGSRRRRIARGSGTSVQAVNRLLKQFEDARRMMRQVEELGRRGRSPFGAGPTG